MGMMMSGKRERNASSSGAIVAMPVVLLIVVCTVEKTKEGTKDQFTGAEYGQLGGVPD